MPACSTTVISTTSDCPRASRPAHHVVAGFAVVALLAAPGCSRDGGAGEGDPATSLVREALHNTTAMSAHVSVDVAQTAAMAGGSTGDGLVDYRAGVSALVFAVKGGGTTEVRQVKGKLYVRSYNSDAERAQSAWVTQDAVRLLDWPPRGLVDPAFVFASAELFRALEDRVVRATEVDPGTSDTRAKAFTLELNSFSSTASQPRPVLTCWVDGDKRIQRVVLVWPTRSFGASAAPGGAQSPARSVGPDGTITITFVLDRFGQAVKVEAPA